MTTDTDRVTPTNTLQLEFKAVSDQLCHAPLADRPKLLAEAKRLTDAMLAVAEEKYGRLGQCALNPVHD
jgi:hypothetical protein